MASLLFHILKLRGRKNKSLPSRNPAGMDKGKQRAVSPPTGDSPDTLDDGEWPTRDAVQLPHITDRESMEKESKEHDEQFWNSIMTERDDDDVEIEQDEQSPVYSHTDPGPSKPRQPRSQLRGNYSCKVNDKETSNIAVDKIGKKNQKVAGTDSEMLTSDSGPDALSKQEDIPSSKSTEKSVVRTKHYSVISETTASSNEDEIHHENSSAPLPSTLTWSVALNHLLTSNYLDPHIVQTIQERIAETSPDSPPTLANTDLVPNFSRPIIGAPFYDRRGAAVPRTLTPDPESEKQLPNGPVDEFDDSDDDSFYAPPPPLKRRKLPHGPVKDSPPGSQFPHPDTPTSDDHALPSGLPTPEEHRLLAPSPPSPSVSPTTQIRRHESTIVTQTKLIVKLHSDIDSLTGKLDQFEQKTLPQLCALLEENEKVLIGYKDLATKMRIQIADLKRAVEFGNRMVMGCWEREWEMWRWTKELSERGEETKREKGLLGRLFGGRRKRESRRELSPLGDFQVGVLAAGGQETSMENIERAETIGSEVSIARQFEAVARVAEQNLRVLKEDVGDMVDLVMVCKGHEPGDCEGI